MMRRTISAILAIVLLVVTISLPAHAGTNEPETCYYSFKNYTIYLPLISAGGGDEKMSRSAAQAQLSEASRRLGAALRGAFQGKVSYRDAVVDYIEYDPDSGNIRRATVTVDGVSGIPLTVNPAERINLNDSIRVENRGSAAVPSYRFDQLVTSSYPNAMVSPGATLPTPTGLTLASTLRIPTSGGQVASITASWRALADSIMQNGVYEVEIKRNEDVEAHTSRCPHAVGSTALDGSATYGDSSVTVDSTASFPSTGRFQVSNAEVSYTGKTSTTFTGLTWHSGSGSYADDTEVIGLTVAFTFDHVEPGRQYNVRVRAVSVTGAVSEWTSASSITTAGNQQLQIEDRFDGYGGSLISPLDSLWWLKVADFDSDEVPNKMWYSYSSIISLEQSTILEGDGALKITWQIDGGGAYRDFVVDLSAEGRFTDDDYVCLAVYPHRPGGATGIQIEIWEDGANVFYYEWNGLINDAWNYLKAKKSDFSTGGTPHWDLITAIYIYFPDGDNAGDYLLIDDLRIVKADEADSTTYSEVGNIWDFVPQQGDGAEWHIYPGNRPGEPSKPFSLGQIKTAASPSTWYLGYHTLADAYYATAVVGGYLKGIDGQIALAFCIQDATLATRTMYAVEADSANDKVRLVRWVNGSRTQIAQADFTFAPNQIVWLGTDWRDFDNENRIKVYASLTEGNVIQAANLVLSKIDANVDRGGPVGVMTKEANARFVDFRAGSPQHAMTAEISFYANVAGAAIEDYGAAVARRVALPATIGVWPMSSVQRSTGQVYDVSGQARHLTYNGNPVFDFLPNGVPFIQLDGTGDYLSRSDETDLDVLGTESLIALTRRGLTTIDWVWFDALGSLEYFMSKSGGVGQYAYWLRKNPTDNIQFQISVDGTNVTTIGGVGSYSNGAWHCVAGVFYPGVEMHLMVDGNWYSNTTSIPASIFNSNADFVLGGISGGSGLLTGRKGLSSLHFAALNDEIVERIFQWERALFGVM